MTRENVSAGGSSQSRRAASKAGFDSNGVRKAAIALLTVFHKSGRHGTLAEVLVVLEEAHRQRVDVGVDESGSEGATPHVDHLVHLGQGRFGGGAVADRGYLPVEDGHAVVTGRCRVGRAQRCVGEEAGGRRHRAIPSSWDGRGRAGGGVGRTEVDGGQVLA